MTVQLRRRMILAILPVVIVGAIVYGFWPQPVRVEVATVHRTAMQVTVEEEGKTRFKDRFVISAPVAGFALRIELKVGDAVAAGQALADLEPMRSTVLDSRSRAEANAQVAAAKAALRAAQQRAAAAKTEADYAQVDYGRIKNLRETGSASQAQLDQVRTRAQSATANQRSAESSVEVARFQVEAAKTALSYSAAQDRSKPGERVRISAPVNGSVLRIYHESEGVVSAGQPLIEIGDPKSMEVDVDVLSADAVRIQPGMRVLLNRWGGNQPLEGRVRVIEPAGFTKISALGVEEQRVNIISDIVSDQTSWQRIGDSYRVEAGFVLWQADQVLQIPASALFRYKDGWDVFVVNHDKAKRRTVQVGQVNGLAAQILDGLKEGETVITHPDNTIEDGVTVETSQQ